MLRTVRRERTWRGAVVEAIDTEGLTKSYGRARGITGLDLQVPPGTVFGFLGPNGAGKTTTIRVLLDFLRPTSGSARVLGLDTRRDSVEIHRRTGYLAGDPGLYDRITARELLGWLGRLRGGVDRAYTDELATRFALELDRPIRSLSRGNRQKVAVVQAFMHHPELLILDEPTSGLDPLIQHEFQSLVHEVTIDGATVFLSSHILDEVQHLCDHVAIVREGRLVAVEDVEDLRRRAMREVTIEFAGPFDASAFAALAGVRAVDVAGPVLHLHLTGRSDELVKLAARYNVVDFTSTPADLDALFLHYYQGEEVDDDSAGR
jgi:ABC-2 type transport system ATP-binding protein